MHLNKGIFITVEGPEGAGKTTVIQGIVEHLRSQGRSDIVVTREPGGVHIAEKIRNIILDVAHTEMDARTEALLFAAARRQHLVEIVLPALASKKIVICDRFVDSSLAYQGLARGLGLESVWQINRFAIEDHIPDLTLLLDVPAEVGIERIMKHRQDDINRLDIEKMSFHNQVRQAFLSLAKTTERIHMIDSTQPIEKVVHQSLAKIMPLLEAREDMGPLHPSN